MMEKISKFTVILWVIAFISVFLLTIELAINLQTPRNFYTNESIGQTKNTNMCCLATIVDENNIKQALVLGHSLSQVSPKIPKIIALQTSQIPSDKKEQLSKYFEIHEVINQTQNLSHQELIYWELEEYYPVIAVRANGVFNSSPYKLCSAPPFSAVSNRGDAIFFDTSFMVLDPKQKLQQDKSTKKFYDLANGQIIDWNPLRTDSSVEDYSNEYIDFWLRYSTPIYIHYADDVFSNALSGSGQTTGSKGLYKIILEIVQKAKRDLGDTLL